MGTDLQGFRLIDYLNSNSREEMKRDILEGITAPQKYIPSKYFYDERGSRLFEEICRLPEYYPTRTEMGILKRYGDEIIRPGPIDLIELGSGTSWKIRLLLDRLNGNERNGIRYIPVDVSDSALIKASLELKDIYPEIEIVAIVADFIHHLELIPSDRQRLILFFGGTIGNLTEEETTSFLRSISMNMDEGDRFFFGIDMLKHVDVLHSAYNDSRGVTAEFNKNILNVINNGLNADFNPSQFEHLAFFNEAEHQIEMHLRAKDDMVVRILDLNITVRLKKGETIRTEICRKFSREGVEEMLSRAGLSITHWFTDTNQWFSIIGSIRAS
jgi:L-histidine N-alpha-methyltransferase